MKLYLFLRNGGLRGQFRDLWRFSVDGVPGVRWEQLEATGAVPEPRSGHRMAAASCPVLFGGFTEDKKRRKRRRRLKPKLYI